MEAKTQLLVGGSRNAHGTRIVRRVKCQRCGTLDHINSRPSKTSGAYCRACAQVVMNTLEVGKRTPRDMKEHTCSNCHQVFEYPAGREPQKGCVCGNCLKGFETWRGSLEMSPESRETMTLEKRSSGVLLRKKS